MAKKKAITRVMLKTRLYRKTDDLFDAPECFCSEELGMCVSHNLLEGYSKLLNTRGLTPSMLKIIDDATAKEVL